ncbi:MAG: RNA polymerase sigma factor [Bacteroidales bacterium]|nr:RNA polymerase sigma factor [Bacteroidales bacterium]
MSERELATLCSRSDRSACRELYMRYAARVFALCLRYTNDRAEAEDLMHDTMIKVYGAIGRFSYKGEGSLYSWIRSIAVHLAIDLIRKNNAQIIGSLDENEIQIADEASDSQREIPFRILSEMITTLPQTQRLIFNLYCIEGFSHKEIADLLGIKMKTSSSLLAKAKKRLNVMVEQYLKAKG